MIPAIRFRVDSIKHLATDRPGEICIELQAFAVSHSTNQEWSFDDPQATLRMTIKNPALKSKLDVGKFYDATFTEISPEALADEQAIEDEDQMDEDDAEEEDAQ